MSKYFEISGFWKEDKEKFKGYIVKETDYEADQEFSDEDVFFYELNEEDILAEIRLGWNGVLDFVITDYKEVEL